MRSQFGSLVRVLELNSVVDVSAQIGTRKDIGEDDTTTLPQMLGQTLALRVVMSADVTECLLLATCRPISASGYRHHTEERHRSALIIIMNALRIVQTIC